MKPTGNRLLVRQIVEEVIVEEPKEGEVVKPKVHSATTVYAKVVAIGGEVKEVKSEDTVAFSPYGYDEVKVGDETLIVISEDLILGIVD